MDGRALAMKVENDALPRVMSDGEVRLETEFSRKWRKNLALVDTVARSEGSGQESLSKQRQTRTLRLASWLKAHLEEELRIKRAERRVERRARNSRVHVVLSGRAVRSEERDDLVGKEAGIEHAQEYLVDGVERLGDGQVGCRLGDVRATCEELETRTTAAVRDTNSAGELDAIETDWGQVMSQIEGWLTSRQMTRRA